MVNNTNNCNFQIYDAFRYAVLHLKKVSFCEVSVKNIKKLLK